MIKVRHLSLGMGLVLAGCIQETQPALPAPSGYFPFDAGRPPGFPPETVLDAAPPPLGPPFGFFGDAGAPPPPARLGTVTEAKQRPPAISGGTLAVLPDGSLAVASDPDRDAIFIVEIASKKVTSLQLPAGSEPGRVALDDSGHAHVVLRRTGELALVDLKSKTLVVRTTVCALPRGVAYQASGGAVIVACASGEVVWLGASDHKESARVLVELDLRDVIVTSDDQVYVSRYRSAELLKLDAGGGVTSRCTPPTAQHDSKQGLLFGAPILPVEADGGVVGDAGVPTPMLPGIPGPVTMTPTLAWRSLPGLNGTVLTLHQRSQVDEVVPGPGGYGGGCDTITHAAVTSFDGHGAGPVGMPLNDAVVAVDATLSADGAWLALAAPGSWLQSAGTLVVYNAALALGQAGNTVERSCGSSALIECSDEQVIAVAFDAQGKLYVQSREPATLTVVAWSTQNSGSDPIGASIVDVQKGDPITLDSGSVRDTGHDLFHGNVGNGLACASCHGEALDDGHVWNFKGFGARRTQNIRGGFLATAPFHWEGDLKNFKSLVDEVMTRRMGGFVVEQAYADTLASWIDQLAALRLPSAEAGAVARGKTLFESTTLGCASCHSGDALTDNQTVDVGTGGAFQVPSLRGLGLRAPFMHDGCAKTLAQRFDPGCGGGDKHGKTSQLSATEQQDLIAYLQSL